MFTLIKFLINYSFTSKKDLIKKNVIIRNIKLHKINISLFLVFFFSSKQFSKDEFEFFLSQDQKYTQMVINFLNVI
jgi:hypothetical protein